MKYSKRLAILLEVDFLSTAGIGLFLSGLNPFKKKDKDSENKSTTNNSNDLVNMDHDKFVNGEKKSANIWLDVSKKVNKEKMFNILLMYLILRYIFTKNNVDLKSLISGQVDKIKKITIAECKAIKAQGAPHSLVSLLEAIFDKKIEEIDLEQTMVILKNENETMLLRAEQKSDGTYDEWLRNFLKPFLEEKEQTK